MKKLFLLIFLLTFILVGCTRPTPHKEIIPDIIDVKLDVPFELHINQTANIELDNVQIQLLELNDERCLSESSCEFDGPIKLHFKTSLGGITLGDFWLTYRYNDPYVKESFDSYTMRISNVKPNPDPKKGIDTNDYIVKVIVTELDSFS